MRQFLAFLDKARHDFVTGTLLVEGNIESGTDLRIASLRLFKRRLVDSNLSYYVIHTSLFDYRFPQELRDGLFFLFVSTSKLTNLLLFLFSLDGLNTLQLPLASSVEE